MQTKSLKLLAVIIAVGVFCGLSVDFDSGTGSLGINMAVPAAAEEVEPALMEGAPTTFMDYWRQGGPTMYALLGLAIWATAVLIELLIKIRVKVFMPADVIKQIKDALSVADYQKAWKIGAENPSPFSRVACASLEKLPKGRDAVEEAAFEAAANENSVFTIKNSYISLCAAIAPLLGLFGTISGMIGAFNAMAYGGAVGDPTRLAGDIGEALLTTYSGLLIAIPCMVLFYVVGNRLRKMMGLVQLENMNLIDSVDFENLPPDLVIATKEMKAMAAAAAQKGDIGKAGKKSAVKQAGTTGKADTSAKADDAAAPAGEVVACPNCNKEIQVGVKACPHCKEEIDWE